MFSDESQICFRKGKMPEYLCGTDPKKCIEILKENKHISTVTEDIYKKAKPVAFMGEKKAESLDEGFKE